MQAAETYTPAQAKMTPSATACAVHLKPRRGPGRPKKSHDNRAVRAWLRTYCDRYDFFAVNPRAEDVIAGVAAAREPGDTRRSLSIGHIFRVLRGLDEITTAGVAGILFCAERTAQTYALAARVAGRALEPLAAKGFSGPELDDEWDCATPDMLDFAAV